mmetsp:Transcript_46640/g.111079  ORF Transcript_46640/g.111079 Transcript_46640/m.111079 type:complete len:231 (-) Transcript_46640:241-933(-)
MHPHRTNLGLVAEVLGGAEDVHRLPADRRGGHVDVRPRDQLREHPTGLLEHVAAERGLGDVEARSHAREVPNVLDRRLGDDDRAVRHEEFVVRLEAALLHRFDQLEHLDVRLGDADCRPHVQPIPEVVAEGVDDLVAPRIHRHDLCRVEPRGVGRDFDGRRGVVEVRAEVGVHLASRHRDRPVHRVGAVVGADGVTVARRRDGSDYGAALLRVLGSPHDWHVEAAAGVRR